MKDLKARYRTGEAFIPPKRTSCSCSDTINFLICLFAGSGLSIWIRIPGINFGSYPDPKRCFYTCFICLLCPSLDGSLLGFDELTNMVQYFLYCRGRVQTFIIFCIAGAESRHSDEALLPDVGYTPPRGNRKIK